MDIPGALTGISTALTIVKQLNEIDARVDEASFKLKIAEVTAALAEAKLGLVDAQQELRDRDIELAELRRKLQFKAEETTSHKGMTYDAIDGKPVGAPYCTLCEAQGKFIRLVEHVNVSGQPWKCPVCKADFQWPTRFSDPR